MEVMAERARQDEKWGEQNHDDPWWLAILVEEVGEAAQAMLEATEEAGDPRRLRKEVVEAVAVGLAWLECMERRAPPSTVGATGEQGLDREGGVQEMRE
jgi:NTP pyrophosphatase (non-canonical NTP hydrolase)